MIKFFDGNKMKRYDIAKRNLIATDNGRSFGNKCNYIPACILIEYSTKSMQSSLNREFFFSKRQMEENTKNKDDEIIF